MGPLYSEGSLEVEEGGGREGQSDVKHREKNLPYHCSLYNEGRGKGPRNAGSLKKLEKAKQWIPPELPERDTALLVP